MFKLEIKTDNAAFTEEFAGKQFEVSRILHTVIVALDRGATGGSVRDINGNTVGTWSLKS